MTSRGTHWCRAMIVRFTRSRCRRRCLPVCDWSGTHAGAEVIATYWNGWTLLLCARRLNVRHRCSQGRRCGSTHPDRCRRQGAPRQRRTPVGKPFRLTEVRMTLAMRAVSVGSREGPLGPFDKLPAQVLSGGAASLSALIALERWHLRSRGAHRNQVLLCWSPEP